MTTRIGTVWVMSVAAVLVQYSVCSSQEIEIRDDVQPEVHLVGIYEGYEQTQNEIHGPRAVVNVDRPGKKVILVLTSYSGATWHVSSGRGTTISKVILGGYEEQAVKGGPETTEVINAFRGKVDPPLMYCYKIEDAKFRGMVKSTYGYTQIELSSFHGAYRPKWDAPITVDAIQNDPRLSVDYPQPTPKSQLPEDVRDTTFFAHHYTQGRHFHDRKVSFGEFTITGPVAGKQQALPKGVTRVAFHPDGKVGYGISGHSVVRFDLKDGVVDTGTEPTVLKMGLEVPRLSWPCDITYDTVRDRVILGSSQYLYAFSTQKEEWSVIGKRPRSLDAFAYSPVDDTIYGVLFEHQGPREVLVLAKVDAKGEVVDRVNLEPMIRAWGINRGPGVPNTQVAIVGKYIAITTGPGGLGRSVVDADYIYLVDPEKTKVWLTAKKK